MQITLNQEEIHSAVEAYVRSQIKIAENQRIEIDFTAGRAPNGLSATLNIIAMAAAEKPAKLRSTGMPRTEEVAAAVSAPKLNTATTLPNSATAAEDVGPAETEQDEGPSESPEGDEEEMPTEAAEAESADGEFTSEDAGEPAPVKSSPFKKLQAVPTDTAPATVEDEPRRSIFSKK